MAGCVLDQSLLAAIAIALLLKFAPADRREVRRFDVVGAVIIACGLGALTWALSQIGRAETAVAASFASSMTLIALFILGLGGIGGYAIWERVTDHPMTPPRLAMNQDFVGLNVATLLIYAGLSIMFFLLPFDLIDRRGLSPTSAGLAFLPFTLAVGLLSPYFGSLADKFGARAMLVAGAVGASVAYIWMLLAHDRSLGLGIIAPQAVLGIYPKRWVQFTAGTINAAYPHVEAPGPRLGALGSFAVEQWEPNKSLTGTLALEDAGSIARWIDHYFAAVLGCDWDYSVDVLLEPLQDAHGPS